MLSLMFSKMCVIEKQNNRILKHLKHLQEAIDDGTKNCERVKFYQLNTFHLPIYHKDPTLKADYHDSRHSMENDQRQVSGSYVLSQNFIFELNILLIHRVPPREQPQ